MSHYFILARMAIITETTNKYLWGCRETGTLVQCWQKYKLVATTTDNSVEFPHKIKKLTYHRTQQFHFWSIYLKKTEKLIQKDKCIPMFTAAIYRSQQPKLPSMDEWIKNDVRQTDTHTHTHTKWNILLSHKKEWNHAICNNMDGRIFGVC